MSNTIKIKRGTLEGSTIPTSLEEGELAYAQNGNKLYIGTNGGTDIKNIGGEVGVVVQGYDADIVSDSTYVATDKNFTTALNTKLGNIEASADVTDTDNVVAALTAGANITIDTDGTIAGQDSYSLPTASDIELGGIKVGDSLSINATTGVLNVITNATLNSVDDDVSLAASQGKILKDSVDDVEDKVHAVGALFQNKLDIIQDTNFAWQTATSDIQDEMMAIVVDGGVVTTQALRDHINEAVSGYMRGDIDGDGEITISDTVDLLRYALNYPEAYISSIIVSSLLQPLYDDQVTWSQYHSVGYLKTNASLPASQVTESTTKRLITDTERTAWAAASNWHTSMTTADTNNVIDTVNELVSAFTSDTVGTCSIAAHTTRATCVAATGVWTGKLDEGFDLASELATPTAMELDGGTF
jgi:hypothetical protein